MKRLHLARALACLLAGAAAPAFAQTTAGVADPQAAVPATPYAPTIHPEAAAAAPTASPDPAWRAANATVGARDAMRLTMPGMGNAHDMSGHDMHGAASAHAPHAGATPAVGAAGPQCGAGNGMQCMAGGSGGSNGSGCCDQGCCCGGEHKEAK